MDKSFLLISIFTFGVIFFFIARSLIYILQKFFVLSKDKHHLPIKDKKKIDNTIGSDYIFWGGLAMCFLFVLGAYGQLIEKNRYSRINIVTKYTRFDGTPLTPAEVKEYLRIERISRNAERGAHAKASRYSNLNPSVESHTDVDYMVMAEYAAALKRGDIRGACNSMMLYSGPNAVKAKRLIEPHCNKLGLSAFAGINKY